MAEELKRSIPRPIKASSVSPSATKAAESALSPGVLSSASTKPKDLDRNRANAAWCAVQEISSKDTEYGSLAREMPTMIQVNGLAQTLAFLKAKKKEHHLKMFNHLSTWVCKQLQLEKGDLLTNVMEIDSQLYRRATSEALAYLQWVKRFTEALIEKNTKKE